MFEENIKSIENPIKPEDIFIDDDYIFDSSGEQDIKNISDQIIQDNNIEQNEVLFEDPKKILNKVLLFDTKKIKEEIIMDKIIQALNNPGNDEFYIEHPTGSNSFILKREDGR